VPQPQSDQFKFLLFAEWEEEGGEYDGKPPSYVCDTIEWKLILNRKAVGRVTEDDSVVAVHKDIHIFCQPREALTEPQLHTPNLIPKKMSR
jgi:hypothetical protein